MLENEKIPKRCIEMERILESNTNNNINLYTSLLFLRNNNFDSRNGSQRFVVMYNSFDLTSKTEIYECLAKYFYRVLDNKQKEVLVDFLYTLDPNMLRNVFLENVNGDEIINKYWIPFINKKLRVLLKEVN